MSWIVIECRWCFQPFRAKSRSNVYCCDACRAAAAWAQHKPGQHTGVRMRRSTCRACGKPFREPAAGPRHEHCSVCGGWREPTQPRAYPASQVRPLWSSANPTHQFAERCATGHRNGAKIQRVEDGWRA